MSKRIIAERSQRDGYGEPVSAWKQIGRSWASKISQRMGIDLADLPADLCCWMMVDVKANRALNGHHHQDNYDDGHGYIEIAEKASKQTNKA